jgi:hypothetical protein
MVCITLNNSDLFVCIKTHTAAAENESGMSKVVEELPTDWYPAI